MNEIQALILGLVQGLTEYLPVSSSGHLTIGQELLGVTSDDNLIFDVVVHVATVLSTLVILWKEVVWLLAGMLKLKWNDEMKYAVNILVSMIPVGIVGVFFKDTIEDIFGSGLLIVGICLLMTASLLAFSYYYVRFFNVLLSYINRIEQRLNMMYLRYSTEIAHFHVRLVSKIDRQYLLSLYIFVKSKLTIFALKVVHIIKIIVYKPKQKATIGMKDAFIIGLAQAIAVLPGLSRSGSTIATGLLLGNDKAKLAQFSFLMVIPPIMGEALLDALKAMKHGTEAVAGDISMTALACGFIAAFVSGCAACQWMVNVVKKGKLIYFAYYCVIIGLLAIVSSIVK